MSKSKTHLAEQEIINLQSQVEAKEEQLTFYGAMYFDQSVPRGIREEIQILNWTISKLNIYVLNMSDQATLWS